MPLGLPPLPDADIALVLAWGNLLALIIAVGASEASGGVLHRWYVIYLLPFVAIAAGAGLAKLWQSRRLRPLFFASVTGGLILIQTPLRAYIGHPKDA